ncbi:MAG TPA: ATP-binding protein [Pyrinomonadaceae bacterium]|nr:ATP-binding protein [Pyrinomonadaceae bacterium]
MTSDLQIGVGQIEPDGDLWFQNLLPAFRRLDERLKLLLAAPSESSEFAPETQPYPGLTITKSEISRCLEQDHPRSSFTVDEAMIQQPLFRQSDNGDSKLAWVGAEYGLSVFDLDVILIALAPELDLGYEKVFGYLQDDITCKRPTLDLTLTVLCPASKRQAGRRHFNPDAPLRKNGLLQLIPSDHGRSELAHQLRLDEGLISLLLDRQGLDLRLKGFCQLIEPTIPLAEVPIDVEIKRALEILPTQVSRQALKLHFVGERGTGKRKTAEALAGQSNSRLLIVDMEHALAASSDPGETFTVILREAHFRDALLYVENLDALLSEDRTVVGRQFFTAVNEASTTIILAGEKPLDSSIRVRQVRFLVPEFPRRKMYWEENLRQHGIALDPETVAALAGSFRLPAGEISSAISAAIDRARWRAAGQGVADARSATTAQPTSSDLFACARARLNHDLAKFARQIDPKYDWGDLVLPADQLRQLREICTRYKYQNVVFDEWGFGRKLSLGKGLNALYSGHPGTGKTMAAEVIARELHLDLYKIDLSQVVSKYIGETEKSLSRIFHEALASSAILFFDEADALFGKRTDVKDSHDRYANIEVSYLLQKMEEYDGIAILATNLRQNIDGAFLRRMQFIVEFPFPDEEHRRRIWDVIFPREAPMGGDVDLDLLARSIRLAGGNLKSIGLAAAFYAAGDGGVIRQEHLISAARREFQKLGQSWNESDQHKEERPEVKRER